MMDAKVVEANTSEDTEDYQERVENFNFDNVLDKVFDYASVQEAIVCSRDNKIVLDLRDKNCIYNQEHHNGEDSTDILLDNQSTVHMMVNSKFLKNIRKSEEVLQLYTSAGMAKVIY